MLIVIYGFTEILLLGHDVDLLSLEEMLLWERNNADIPCILGDIVIEG